jgi:hypothetical protein
MQSLNRHLHSLSLAFCLALFTTALSAQVTGTITGYVREAGTQRPLGSVNVSVEGTTLGGTTDSNGLYRILKVPTKSFTLKATLVGYQPAFAYDVMVTSGNSVQISFEMEPQANTLQDVVVKRSTFVKPLGVVNSVQALGFNEIAKYPGANFDIAKVVQSLPGVGGSVGFRNDIIIRGGAPNENVYYLDGIEIPTINHFATQGAAGGPVGMLNVSFVDQVALYTSAFPAKYDNPLSGVLQFRQRSGNPDRTEGNFRLSASEAAFTLEGPFSKKNPKTTYIVSARRSYLQFLFKLIDLPFLPDYWDYQFKVTHKPNTKNEFGFLGLGSIDNFSLNPPEDPTLEQQAILDGLPLNSQWTTTVGGYWRRQIKNGNWQLSLSKNILNNSADKWEDNEKPSDDTRVLAYNSREDETRLRYEYNKVWNEWSFSAGAHLINSDYTNSTYQRRPDYEANYSTDINFWRYGMFGQVGRRFFNRKLNVIFGLRTDGNTYTNTGNELGRILSPRLALAYTIVPGLTANASFGRYYKIPPYTILGYTENGVAVNKDNEYIQNDHLVAGLEWTPASATRITLEGFRKWYDDYPVSVRNSISMANLGGGFGVFGNERVSSTGLGRTWGVEFTYQQRLTKNFYGIFAYTWYYSEFTGPDRSTYLPSAWDNRHLVSFTGGYKFRRNWEVGIRFRYQGEAPATPWNDFESKENYPFTGEAVPDWANINTLRLDAFNAMDLRVDKKWNFKGWSLNLFLDIQNLYNSLNPTQPGYTLQRNPDGSIATSTGVPYNPGEYGNPAAPNNRQQAIGVVLPNESGSRLPSVGFVIVF